MRQKVTVKRQTMNYSSGTKSGVEGKSNEWEDAQRGRDCGLVKIGGLEAMREKRDFCAVFSETTRNE